MTLQEKSAQVVIRLLSRTAAPTENLVPWQSLFCSILQETKELLKDLEFFRHIQQTKNLFLVVKKGVNF